MSTELIYLDDANLFHSQAALRSIGRDARGVFVTLDRTVAYPQGGGQASDCGHLASAKVKAPLLFVGFDDGEVRHYVPDTAVEGMSIGEAIEITIDSTHRILNASLHTAGHLVSHVAETMSNVLIPAKGYHFKNGPYVEFLNQTGIDAPALLESINLELSRVIFGNAGIEAKLSSFQEIEKIRPTLAPHIPKDKPARVVIVGDYPPLPCGGTHLRDLSSFDTIRVTKAKRAKENVRMSYEIKIRSPASSP